MAERSHRLSYQMVVTGKASKAASIVRSGQGH